MLRAVFGQRGNHGDAVYNNNDGSKLTIRGAIEAHLNVVGTGNLIAGRWTQTQVTRALRRPPLACGEAGNMWGGGCTNLYVLSEGVPGAGAAGAGPAGAGEGAGPAGAGPGPAGAGAS